MPRGQTIVLNDAFIEQVGEAGVARYVEVLAAAERHAADHSEDEVIAFLRDHLDGTILERAKTTYEVLAGMLHDNEGVLSVVTNEGKVLLGDPNAGPTEAVPSVRGTEDPADPERPVYS